MSDTNRTEGGERPGTRAQMDRFTGHLVKHGMDPEKAKALAVREALKQDETRKR